MTDSLFASLNVHLSQCRWQQIRTLYRCVFSHIRFASLVTSSVTVMRVLTLLSIFISIYYIYKYRESREWLRDVSVHEPVKAQVCLFACLPCLSCLSVCPVCPVCLFVCLSVCLLFVCLWCACVDSLPCCCPHVDLPLACDRNTVPIVWCFGSLLRSPRGRWG